MKMDKNIEEMTTKEIKKDFERLKKKNEAELLLEYLYCVASLKASCDKENLDKEELDVECFLTADYYSKLKNRVGEATNSIYVTTNESLKNLFHEINVKDKKIATVGSSGDQALNAIFKGAKQVDLIDGNLLTRAFVELKIAAIKGLKFSEFKDWIKNVEAMREGQYFKYYQKFSHKLPDDMRLFWDCIMLNEMGMSDVNFLGLFYTTNNEVYIKNAGEFYADIKKFYVLKKQLNKGDYKLNYIFAEFEDFPQKLKGKYDYILLSNIVDYCDAEKFCNIARDLYRNNIKAGGSMQVGTYSLPYHLHCLVYEEDCFPVLIENAGIRGDECLMMKKPLPRKKVSNKVEEREKAR